MKCCDVPSEPFIPSSQVFRQSLEKLTGCFTRCRRCGGRWCGAVAGGVRPRVAGPRRRRWPIANRGVRAGGGLPVRAFPTGAAVLRGSANRSPSIGSLEGWPERIDIASRGSQNLRCQTTRRGGWARTILILPRGRADATDVTAYAGPCESRCVWRRAVRAPSGDDRFRAAVHAAAASWPVPAWRNASRAGTARREQCVAPTR